MMSLRQLASEELYRLATQIRVYEQFEAVRTFAHTLYGSTAQSVSISIGFDYDSRYGQISHIERVRVFDGQHRELLPDLSLPYWQEEGHSISQEDIEMWGHESPEAYAQEYIEINHLYHDEFGIYIPDECTIYDLDNPPIVVLPTIYIEE